MLFILFFCEGIERFEKSFFPFHAAKIERFRRKNKKKIDSFFATVPATVPIFRNRSQKDFSVFCCGFRRK